MLVRLKLYRDHDFVIKEFVVPTEPRQTLLDVLFYIKEEYDPTISFRSMCRAGICGTCGVKANQKPILACKTAIKELGEEVLVEPLDNMCPVKDLVVEHGTLIDRIKKLKVWYEPLQENLQRLEINPFLSKSFDCIACGLCDSSCPIFVSNSDFGGPMAFSRAYKLLQDRRHSKAEERLLLLKDAHINLCTHCKNCSIVCPMGVMPEMLIKLEETELLKRGMLSQGGVADFGFF
ncbi:MAG: succinate dehydrogenase/fumarate reductase iron-sulfur subunit [Thermocrinis sp.]|jgi:succinate dehydrogenase / fumarate reductase iron-sulfur subunit/fumarate reductase iron-sulfur subunit|uniref:succinate dehydrogenase/fumarate reductase iron-sulfur subunit n=1 Tax=Thermocrinis sp. TaxID=2024383 RepID=UPI003C064007